MPARLYLQLQVDFDDDEKVARLARYTRPGEARACRDLLVAMWRYIKRERSDGHVPFEIVGRLVYPDTLKTGLRDADRLVEVGLAERTDSGYYLGGYLKHNKSRAQLEEESRQKAEAGAKGGRAAKPSNSQANGKHPAYQPANQDAEQSAKPGAEPFLSQRTENREQTSENNLVETLGGDVTKTDAQPATPPAPPTCHRHPNGNPNDQPCRACRALREWTDRQQNAERKRAMYERDACTLCDETGWQLNPETGLPVARCNHRSTA